MEHNVSERGLEREPYASPTMQDVSEQSSGAQLGAKPVSASHTIKASIVLPPDTNHHGTIFGGKLMAYIDDVATIAATRHSRRPVVTASTDSVDFLQPVKKGDAVCLSAFVTWTSKTSMEIFVRVITEDLLTGERKVCATSFLTFVALGEDGRPTQVPGVIPSTPEERMLHESAPMRKEARRIRREESKKFAQILGVDYKLASGAPQAAASVDVQAAMASGQQQAAAVEPAVYETEAVSAGRSQAKIGAAAKMNEVVPADPWRAMGGGRQEARGRAATDGAYAAAWGTEW